MQPMAIKKLPTGQDAASRSPLLSLRSNQKKRSQGFSIKKTRSFPGWNRQHKFPSLEIPQHFMGAQREDGGW